MSFSERHVKLLRGGLAPRVNITTGKRRPKVERTTHLLGHPFMKIFVGENTFLYSIILILLCVGHISVTTQFVKGGQGLTEY
jgi:hypothetical protein